MDFYLFIRSVTARRAVDGSLHVHQVLFGIRAIGLKPLAHMTKPAFAG
jgi:hypothetical protein